MSEMVPVRKKRNAVLQLLRPKEEGALLAQPQKLGFLPTLGFWYGRKDLKWRAILFNCLAVAPILLPATVVFREFVFENIIAWVAMWTVFGNLPVGFLERYVRRKALERRAEEPPALAGGQ